MIVPVSRSAQSIWLCPITICFHLESPNLIEKAKSVLDCAADYIEKSSFSKWSMCGQLFSACFPVFTCKNNSEVCTSIKFYYLKKMEIHSVVSEDRSG